jgi:hypothetical protein
MTIYAGSKPTVIDKGIKLTSVVAHASGGIDIAWEIEDERITVGEDEFIVQYRERQIPSRTGYGKWKELGRTKDTSISAKGFYLDRDMLIRIKVNKGAISE